MEPQRDRGRDSGYPMPSETTTRKRQARGKSTRRLGVQPPREAGVHPLAEEIACSVCLHDLQDPVSIACGHTYCRACISKHWAGFSSQGFLCPECKATCPGQRMVPNYRLASLISKIRQGAEDNTQADTRGSPGVWPPDYPVRLVCRAGDGTLILNESGARDCFQSPGVSDCPAVLLSVIGEKRRGKSFLMNYIIRALRSQERGEEFTMGSDEDPLHGFDWRTGADSITQGLWMWSRPFILSHKETKIAVYVMDTEGSLDLVGDRETCVKLCALSMRLTSHLIFNVASSLKETEMDCMETYMHMGEEYRPRQLQCLDILIRDWHGTDSGRGAARGYIAGVIEKLEKQRIYPKVLLGLKSRDTRCFLLPHPGKRITAEGRGALADMDADFRRELRSYVGTVVERIRGRIGADAQGEEVLSRDLVPRLQEFVELLNQQKFGFSSPLEMFYAVKKQKDFQMILDEFQDFLGKQPFYRLTPTMRKLVAVKRTELVARFGGSSPDSGPHGETLVAELESRLLEMQEKFCSEHTKRLTGSALMAVSAGYGAYGMAAGMAARGAAMAAEPVMAAGGRVLASDVVAGAASLVQAGLAGLVGRFLR
ncbi:RING finger protein 112-like [Spea bombifrons]|uniref:RING finger protein 112-like n=1 Tax=Spea bombifrons TaxID=233779 RepID=UPI00234AD252|nr:RING finger protein 112-like [Spea bombifrons]